MTVEEAYSKFKKRHPDLVVMSCHEYETCFVFHAIPGDYIGSDKENMMLDSLYAVDKADGALTLFNPLDISEEEYKNGKKLRLSFVTP